ncbi:MAG: O-antigen polysaccharide polymerase Wzy family protein [Thermomicrobia bacterium]|nr:O-antigen polysaccharide polymerase Wzy family protein [Thermomicrobia bacterium]
MTTNHRDPTPHDRAAATVIATHLFFVLGALIAYVWGRPLLGWTDASLLYPASLLLLVSFAWSLWSWKRLTESVFDPYGLFLIAAFFFNAGSAFLYVVHMNTSGIMILDFTFTPAVTLQTLVLVFLTLGVFHLGALVIAGGQAGKLFPVPSAVDEASPSAEQIRFVGWALIVVSAVPMALQLKQAASVVLSSGYFALYQQDYATGLQASGQFLASFLVPGALVLLAGSKVSRSGRLTSLGVIALYALVQLFLGSRYHAIGPVIAYVWLWHRVIRPIPRWLLGGAAIFVFVVVFPVIAATRDTSGANRLSASALVTAFSGVNNPLIAVLSETGGTMVTIAHTLTLVPSVRGYDFGAGYFFAATTLIPNLFWTIHPAIAHGLASDWLVWLVDPSFASQGGGFGYSFIAEAYLNWGWIGAPLFLGLVGYLLAKLIFWGCRTGALAKLAVVASFLSFAIFWARGEAIDVVRPLVWYALIPYLLIRLVASIDRRRVAPLTIGRLTLFGNRTPRESEKAA